MKGCIHSWAIMSFFYRPILVSADIYAIRVYIMFSEKEPHFVSQVD